VVAIVTYVCAGYFDETDDVVGISHVLEHMYFKGTASRGVGEIAKETKSVGGYLNAATIYDHTTYYTVVPSSGFRHGLEVQADAYANSLIDTGELARELEVIVQEAKRKADNPSAVAIETLYAVLHDRHRIRRWRIGREPELRALTRDAVVAFYRNYYHPGNTILSIVGDVDADRALAEIEQLYGGLPEGEPERQRGPTEEGVAGFRYREGTADIGQTQLALGWRTPGTTHPDSASLDLLASLLGSGRASRLFRAVRERRLVSSISAYNYTPTELGVFVIHAEGPPSSTADAARTTWSELRSVHDGDFGELEVERAKRVLESRWVRRLEDMEGQANYLAEWEALGDWEMGGRYLERLLAATRDDVVTVAQRYLAPENAAVVVYRSASSAPVAASADEMRTLLDAEPRPPSLAAPAAYVARSAATTAMPHFERGESTVRVYRTSLGIPVLVHRKPGTPLMHAGVYVLGGARDEPRNRSGLTMLTVRTALKGTTHRTALQIAEDGEVLGGSVAGSTAGESFGWSISVPTRYAAAALELLADVIQYPTMQEEALETERAVAIAEAIAVRDDMFRYPVRLAMQAAFDGHPYGSPVGGTEESLRAVTAEEVKRWHAERALAGPSVIAIVGDEEPDDLAAIAARPFAELTASQTGVPPRPLWPQRLIVNEESRDRAQTALALLFPGPTRGDQARFSAAMIASVASGLGGRFFDELREKRSLCYAVNALTGERQLAGTFAAYVATSPEQEDAARAALLAEFRRLRDEPVTDDELARAQTYSIGVHAIRQQHGSAVLADMVDAWLLGNLRELGTFEASVRAVTPASMQQIAQEYFDATRRVEGIVRGVRGTRV